MDIDEATLRFAVLPGDTAASVGYAAFPCPTGESARNAAFPCDTGESPRNAAFPCDIGESARDVAFPGDAGDSVGYIAFPSNAGESCDTGHYVRNTGKSCDAGESARDIASPSNIGVAVRSMCSTMHDLGLGGGASKLCSHMSKTAPSAVGINLPGNFNACVARLASSIGTVMLSSTGHGTSRRFRCRRHSSKHASVWAGARKYTSGVCNTTGATPCSFRSGAKTWTAWIAYFCDIFAR